MTEYVELNKSYKVDGRNVVVYDIESINESIDNLITTKIGERVFNRALGSNLSQILFEPLTDTIVQDSVMKIHQVLLKYEPRVRLNLNNSSVTFERDESRLDIFLQYVIKSTNQVGIFSKTIRYN